MTNRKAPRAQTTPAPQQVPPPDLDTIYRPELTGADIDVLGNLIDAWVKHGGVQVVGAAIPLLERITAPRKKAMTD